MKYILIFFFLLSFSLQFKLNAQVKIGQWVDHLSYNFANSVSKVGSTVYVSNGQGLAKYDENDNSISKLTKIDGLSDVGVSMIKKNEANNVLLVIYNNANIDAIQPNGTIINVSDLKRKIIPGKKVINEVYFNGKFAYLSCGFGILVFDTEKTEIKETFQIGNGVSFKEIYQVCKNDTAIFAATESGVYFGPILKNLSNYQNWSPLNTGITAGPYNTILSFDNKILANYSAKLATNTDMADTIWQYNGATWSKYPFISHSENKKMYDNSRYGKLTILDQFGLKTLTTSGTLTDYITNYGFATASINDGYYDGGSKFYIADKHYGLIKSDGGSTERITINGPANNYVNDIDIKDGNLVIAPVNLGPTFAYTYNNEKPNLYQNKEWSKLSLPDSLKDLNCVAIDPKDKTHFVFGSMGFGVIEFKNNVFSKVYNVYNTPMIGFGGSNQLWLTGINFDKNSNIWALNSGSTRAVSVFKGGVWNNLNFDNVYSKPTISKIIFDKYDQAWMVMARSVGVMVYKDVNSLTTPSPSNTKLLSAAKGNGLLPTPDIYSICEDLDGKIWLGTGKGVAVFYNPENVFTGSNFDSQQILIEQDNHVQILLENDIITAIAVDGVNRKWIGTESSGVYCFTSDGQTQIYHFSTDNSPIYSNIIRDVAVDDVSGDVFIATEKGVQSFRTSVIKGFEDFSNLHVFPNPVKPGYSGNMYITGLIDEAVVKITDVAGNLVWETKSQGGQVEWNVETFSGKRVASGVYMVYCASVNGELTGTTKFLVVN